MHYDEIINTAAKVAEVVENGVAMRRSNTPNDPPAAPSIVVSGISGAEFFIGIAILALAMLAAGLIVRSGLVA